MSATIPLVLSVDGGGTKTLAVVADADGHVHGVGVGGPTNPLFAPARVVRASLREAVLSALRTAGVAGDAVDMAVAAFAGEVDVARHMRDTGIRAWRVVREPDLCLAAGVVEGRGAVVLAGTGAFAWARGPRGEHLTDGLGAVIGDEGSAYWLVREGLVAVGRAYDGRGPRTALTEALCTAVDVSDVEALGRWLYGAGGRSRREVAALAPVVARTAERGDRVARTVCRRAGERLAHAVRVSAVRAGLGTGEPFPVILAGGVLRGAEPVRGALLGALSRTLPDAQPRLARYEPALGGVLLAWQAMGVVWDEPRLFELDEGERLVARAAGQAEAMSDAVPLEHSS